MFQSKSLELTGRKVNHGADKEIFTHNSLKEAFLSQELSIKNSYYSHEKSTVRKSC